MDIIFASDNAGKIRECATLFSDTSINIIPQSTRQVSNIAETGLTFVENALIKARHACQATGLPAIADDSGLEVEALGGAPGIYSARFAGDHADSNDNVHQLLEQLIDVPLEKRLARFYCVIVFLKYAKDPCPLICEGSWYGHILEAPSGAGGFGYDPIFWDPKNKKSAAELSITEKNAASHRGIALKHLKEKLLSYCR